MTCTDSVEPRVYRSIFLDHRWAHQRYLGWAVVEELAGLRILQKGHAIFDRYLMLLTKGGEAALEEAITRFAGRAGLSDIFIHDFDHALTDAPVLAGFRFRRAERHERLLNIATFAVDLQRDEATIFASMSSNYRRQIRKAEATGLNINAHPRPDAALCDGFFSAYVDLAHERGLQAPDPAVIKAMYAAGDAVLFVASRDGEISNYLHVYIAGETGVFMHGVNLSKVNDGAGQYLHWQAMRHLKAHGRDWYDLGGVATLDPADGIFNFKEKFGAMFVPLGVEWRYTGSVVRRAISARATIGRLAARRVRS